VLKIEPSSRPGINPSCFVDLAFSRRSQSRSRLCRFLTGIFANYGFALSKAGPFGYWTWILVSLGHLLVALVFAEMAGRIPLAGCSYNWNTKLSHPVVGWIAGWMALVAYTVGIAAVTATLFPVFQSLFGWKLDAAETFFMGIGLVFILAVINVYGVRGAAYINLWAVAAEVIALVGFGILLAAAWLLKGVPNVELLTSIPAEPRPYLPAFLMACLLCSWTLLGFEGAADVSEETVEAVKVAPKSIIHSVLSCAVLGFAFVLLLTLNITDLGATAGASDPVTAIISGTFGELAGKAFLVLIFVSVFACALVNMTGATRVLFAMARDGKLPAANWLVKVSRHRVPSNGTWLVAVVSAVFLSISENVTALYGAGAVLFALFYMLTVLGYAVWVRGLPDTDSFSLGRWRWPVVVLAVAWLALEIGILTVPEQFQSVGIATACVLGVGLLLYLATPRSSVQSV
jgi:amino acid transporter